MQDKDLYLINWEILMKDNYKEVIKERLDNKKEWLTYYKWLLTHRELHQKAKRAYYKERPIQNLIIKLYFLPLNFIRFFSYLFDRCRYDMIKKEIEVLNDEFDDKIVRSSDEKD